MSSKIANISERASVLCCDEKTSAGLSRFVTAFRTSRFLRSFDWAKGKVVYSLSFVRSLRYVGVTHALTRSEAESTTAGSN